MTGIEKLRDWVGTLRLSGLVWADHMADELESIAEQIKRETQPKSDPAADVSMSAYDLLPEEEREAIAWVREHGGIAYVKDAWRVRSNLDRQLEREKAKVERQQRHIEFVQGKCRERRERIAGLDKAIAEMKFDHIEAAAFEGLVDDIAARLGASVDGLDSQDARDRIMDALDKHLMPEGMEWPRYEDGAPVKFGDVVDGVTVRSMVFRENRTLLSDCTSVPGWGTWRSYAEPIKRPAHKALDADGAEIRVGDVLYSIETGESLTVDSTESGNAWFGTTDGLIQHCSKFTHRAPVLAADGKPLRVGETVWSIFGGIEGIIERVDYERKGGEACAYVRFADMESLNWVRPDVLTHERPDSWERLEEDAAGASCPDVYCANHHIDASDASYEWAMAGDIVRRAKALAERDA